MSALLDRLAAITAAHPTARKLLIAPSVAWGRDALTALARTRGGWLGWTPMTLATVADELAYVPMARAQLRMADAIELEALLDAAIEECRAVLDPADDLVTLLDRAGVRIALLSTLDELARAEVPLTSVPSLTDAARRRRWQSLCTIGTAYRARVAARGLIDRAGMARLALTAIDDEWPWIGDAVIVLAGLDDVRGIDARLRDALTARGARTVAVTPAHDDTPPARAWFVAATPADEVREVLRRAIADGVSLDDVELIATDDDAYGIAVDAVGSILGIGASLRRGLPMSATAMGRRALRVLDDAPLTPEASGPPGIARIVLAHLAAIEIADGTTDAINRDTLASVLRACIDAAWPPMSSVDAVHRVRVAIESARGASAVSGLHRRTQPSAVREHDASWTGRLHLTTLAHAGMSGRRWRAVLGLDADRTSGPSVQSAILPDAMRALLSSALATTALRRAERAQRLAHALATAAEGASHLTLSYASASAEGGRDAAPSTVLLEAMRAVDATVTSFEQLRERVGAPVGAVPRHTNQALDAREVWLAALSDGRLLLDGTALVTAAYPGLARGLAKAASLDDPRALAWHGAVPQVATRFDPRPSGAPLSASSLETIGSCALRWYYAKVLGLSSPEPPPDPAQWLDAATRGKVLHALYAQVARAGLLAVDTPLETRVSHAIRLLDGELSRQRTHVPPPSEGAFDTTRDALVADVRLFLAQEARDGTPAVEATELSFGGERRAAVLALPDGSALALRGSIDRVDRLADASWRIIDYKSGRAHGSAPDDIALDGGRRLQLPLYAVAAEQILGGTVSVAEYRYATARGGGEREAATAADRDALPAVVASLLDAMRDGEFFPTNSAADCAYCDYATICSATRDTFGKTESPRAAWAARAASERDAPAALRAQATRRGADAP
ncbi:MAG: PD-(D/E)XK nuclease family protein [Gemmatimonadaceae bacterium]|nr:PD-(D/E)XK nuclease family protein [Gemmatimonadaceae bacterium]